MGSGKIGTKMAPTGEEGEEQRRFHGHAIRLGSCWLVQLLLGTDRRKRRKKTMVGGKRCDEKGGLCHGKRGASSFNSFHGITVGIHV